MEPVLLLGHFVSIGQRQLNKARFDAHQAHIQMLHHALAGQTGGDAVVFGGVHGVDFWY
jgi:hypothetical protein